MRSKSLCLVGRPSGEHCAPVQTRPIHRRIKPQPKNTCQGELQEKAAWQLRQCCPPKNLRRLDWAHLNRGDKLNYVQTPEGHRRGPGEQQSNHKGRILQGILHLGTHTTSTSGWCGQDGMIGVGGQCTGGIGAFKSTKARSWGSDYANRACMLCSESVPR